VTTQYEKIRRAAYKTCPRCPELGRPFAYAISRPFENKVSRRTGQIICKVCFSLEKEAIEKGVPDIAIYQDFIVSANQMTARADAEYAERKAKKKKTNTKRIRCSKKFAYQLAIAIATISSYREGECINLINTVGLENSTKRLAKAGILKQRICSDNEGSWHIDVVVDDVNMEKKQAYETLDTWQAAVMKGKDISKKLARHGYSRGFQDRTNDIGKKLRKMREKRGLTLKQVSEACRTGKGYLSEVERGIKNPSPDILYRLYKFYGVKYTKGE
jgi:hypothetical protein